ncbi:RNA-directed DNA polymerase [Streptomyces erythrochromogenes]|uniref:RNA-directed DNA polymerase n=1 Tax=Streptomyces erythrochromogenes TaxID=285574 RepID=UPI00224E0C3E|nr:RNA-directed DNA polymerase [Streptomyces erythrochromogenes]MCX5584501.1 RNA-directed DNA polymerase [Streptomyces erythrochromogenes]
MNASFGLDAKKAAEICTTEMFGDWYRDPWAWPELNWISGRPQDFPWNEIILKDGSLRTRRDPWFEPIIVPKSRLGVRPAVVMSLDCKIAYAAAVNQVSGKMHADLPEWVHGWRLRGGTDLAKNGDEWTNYMSFFDVAEENSVFALQTDITSFFASIDVERMSSIVYDVAGKSAGAQLIEHILLQHDQMSSRSGLPQRSWASAVLANRYMTALDDLIAKRLDRRVLTGAVRWMDDIYVTGEESQLYRFFLEFQNRVREMGLEANASKSNLGLLKNIKRDVLLEDLKEIPVPVKRRMVFSQFGSDVRATEVDEIDLSDLKSLESAALKSPHLMPGTSLKLVLKTLRKHEHFERFEDWLLTAERLPHVADALGRYFRDAIKGNRDLLEKYCFWLANFCSTPWAAIPWASAQFALAVPGFKNPAFIDTMQDWLDNSTDIHQISVAAQRLSRLDPVAAKDIIRSRVDSEARPVFQRVYALSLLSARDDKALVAKLIKRDPRNVLTAQYLEAAKYAVPKVAEDYDWVASAQ